MTDISIFKKGKFDTDTERMLCEDEGRAQGETARVKEG